MPSDETADDGKKSCDSLILANEQSASPIMSGTAPEYRTKGTCGFIMIARAREPVIAVRTKYPSFSRSQGESCGGGGRLHRLLRTGWSGGRTDYWNVRFSVHIAEAKKARAGIGSRRWRQQERGTSFGRCHVLLACATQC